MRPFLKKTTKSLLTLLIGTSIIASCSSLNETSKNQNMPITIPYSSNVDSTVIENLRVIVAYAHIPPLKRRGLDINELEEKSYNTPIPGKSFKNLQSSTDEYTLIIYNHENDNHITILKNKTSDDNPKNKDLYEATYAYNSKGSHKEEYTEAINDLATYINQEALNYNNRKHKE